MAPGARLVIGIRDGSVMQRRRIVKQVRWTACMCLFVLTLVACGDDDAAETPSAATSDPGVVHVHGLGRNPTDESLMIATHTGLFRVARNEAKPTRVAGRYQD